MSTADGDPGDSAASDKAAGIPSGYRALTSSCAVAPAPPASWLEIRGDDRSRFLHGQTTCDVKSLVVGGGVYGFLVDAKGKVLADAVISASIDRLVVELPPGTAQETAQRLQRYVVADRVDIVERDPMESAVIAGPEAARALGTLLAEADAPAGWGRLEVMDGKLEVRGELRYGIPAWRLVGPPRRLSAAVEKLGRSGAAAADAAALETVRIEHGMPRAGIDFDRRHFPQETGLEDWAVSYTKGCYLGQEVVARIHYRGRVNHQLRGLVGQPGESAPTLGPLRDGAGETAGELTSGVWSPSLDRPIGLSILHRRWAEPGTRLLADGRELAVVTLPFVAAQTAPVPSDS